MAPELFDRVQAILKERGENYPLRSSNSTTYVLTSLMRCGRCGHGFVGTAAHGRGGTTYRYYSCFSRQRQGTARCDQERIPADALEDAVLREALAALDDGSIFEEAARRALEEWHEAHPETERELRRIEKRIEQRRKAIDRYVESRASIQPYFVAPAVRTLLPSRRRTGIESACELSPAHRC